jgi:hypothetical protein
LYPLFTLYIMGRSPPSEMTVLIMHKPTINAPPKFPLGLVPEPVRPYLELIRLEKVR